MCSSAARGEAAPTSSPGRASRHPYFALIPVEVRFHVEERGFPGLLAGTVSRDRLRQPPARVLVEGLSDRAHAERSASSRSSGSRRRSPPSRQPSRTIPRPLAGSFSATCSGSGPPGRTPGAWSSRAPTRSPRRRHWCGCSTVPRFIHVVRDGRDASASRVAQTRGSDLPADPTPGPGVVGGADQARPDAGSRAIPPDRLLTVSLDELVMLGVERPVAALPLPGGQPREA